MATAEQMEADGISEEFVELGLLDRVNLYLSRSWVGRFFECEKRNTTFFQELRAGAVCF
eukprot:CAMPEP_0202878214 /NCGR_PEP_ID=MMETSP1391-20130828/31849_1 /ASSEMBLY_ACC=CAM_ASM_000867 /TAXON_ID=1034604 /ORGANISM="Chlamydomonas leiostraca, Strain SAG 11-49" /LENGTH=58 /DNA_ID=CAMNT_0049560375 /DNA_START=97 /DNA_END=270 /DNA_ORIENTATION=+